MQVWFIGLPFTGICVYNVVVLCLIGLPVGLLMKDQLDASYVLVSLFVLFATSLTLCLVFIPKVMIPRITAELQTHYSDSQQWFTIMIHCNDSLLWFTYLKAYFKVIIYRPINKNFIIYIIYRPLHKPKNTANYITYL